MIVYLPYLRIFIAVTILYSVVGPVLFPAYAEKYPVDGWRVSRVFEPGWTESGFDDSLWIHPVAPSRGKCTYKADKANFSSPMWIPDPRSGETLYFRHIFTAFNQDEVILKTNFDDDGDVYINGLLIYSDRSGKTEAEPAVLDLTDYILDGENILAIRVIDRGGCQWMQAVLNNEPELSLGVPLFKQTDPQWALNEYDHGASQELWCGTTIADCGCALSSLAMIADYHGVHMSPDGSLTSPESLNTYFNQDAVCSAEGCASKGYVYGNVRWTAIQSYSAEAHALFGTDMLVYAGSGGFDESVIQDDITSGNPVVAKAPEQSHWFVLGGLSGNSYFVNDPLFDEDLLSGKYNNTVSAIRRFRTSESAHSSIDVYSKSREDILIEGPADATVLHEEKIDSRALQSSKITWYHIQNPPSGMYAITANEEIVLYTEDTQGRGKPVIHRDGTLYILYDADSSDNTLITNRPVCSADPISADVKEMKISDVDGDGISDILFLLKNKLF